MSVPKMDDNDFIQVNGALVPKTDSDPGALERGR
jgi:hypothetical protein